MEDVELEVGYLGGFFQIDLPVVVLKDFGECVAKEGLQRRITDYGGDQLRQQENVTVNV